MKKLNLIEKLQNASKGLKLYSPFYGELTYEAISTDCIGDKVIVTHQSINSGLDTQTIYFKSDGRTQYNESGEVMLFPSRNNRCWDKFIIEGNDEYNKFTNGQLVECDNRLSRITDITSKNITIQDVKMRFHTIIEKEFFEKEVVILTKKDLKNKYCKMLDSKDKLIRWKPDIGKDYYYINDCGVIKATKRDDIFDKERIEMNNCFPNKKYAEFSLKKMKKMFKNIQLK